MTLIFYTSVVFINGIAACISYNKKQYIGAMVASFFTGMVLIILIKKVIELG